MLWVFFYTFCTFFHLEKWKNIKRLLYIFFLSLVDTSLPTGFLQYIGHCSFDFLLTLLSLPSPSGSGTPRPLRSPYSLPFCPAERDVKEPKGSHALGFSCWTLPEVQVWLQEPFMFPFSWSLRGIPVAGRRPGGVGA